MPLSAELVQCSPCSRCAYTSTAGQKGMLSSSSPSLVKQSWVSTNRFAVYCWPCSAQGSAQRQVPSGAGTGALHHFGQSLNIVFFQRLKKPSVSADFFRCSPVGLLPSPHWLILAFPCLLPNTVQCEIFRVAEGYCTKKKKNKTPPLCPCLLMRAYSISFSHFVLFFPSLLIIRFALAYPFSLPSHGLISPCVEEYPITRTSF